jgi:hypothetical protein
VTPLCNTLCTERQCVLAAMKLAQGDFCSLRVGLDDFSDDEDGAV